MNRVKSYGGVTSLGGAWKQHIRNVEKKGENISREEFDRLPYEERMLFAEKYPAAYKRLSRRQQ